MKTKITLLLLILFSYCEAQTEPTYQTFLTNDLVEGTFLDKSTNILYLCYEDSGEIKKLDVTNPSAAQTLVISGLSYPMDAVVVGNRLYFTEFASGLDANDMPIPNTGKLSYIDLSQTNPTKVTILNNLNIPWKLAAATDFVIMSENTISAIDSDDFDKQMISKVNLTGTVTKTPIITRTFAADNPTDEAFEYFEVVGNILYANSYNTSDDGYFYKIPLDTKVPTVTHTFTQHAPYSFAINQNTFYFGDGFGPGNTYKTPLSSMKVTPITTDFHYNSNGANIYDWNFDANGNVYVLVEDSAANIYLFKYTSQQLLQTSEHASLVGSWNVYPNPAVDNLNFSKDLKEMKIFDFSGKLILENNDVNQKINLRNLKAGAYLISGTDINGNKVSRKFIKK